MKYLIILSLFLFSCGVQHHINKAKKHTEKAIDKGAIFTASNDTLYINDTIITERIYTRNDTVFLERTITVEKVITQSGEIRYITKHDKRVEVREEKKAVKREYKLDKAKEKTKRVIVRKENKKGSKWIILFILVAIITIYLLWKNKKV